MELVNFCGSKLVESLNKDNVLELGQLAEQHNADELLNKCIKYILENLPNSLNKDWKNHMKESPRMMLKIMQHLLAERTDNKIYEINRLGQGLITGHYGFLGLPITLSIQTAMLKC